MSVFDFNSVDRLTLAPPERIARLADSIVTTRVGAIGAAVEYEFVRRQPGNTLPRLPKICDCPRAQMLSALLDSGHPDPVWSSTKATEYEFILLGGEEQADAQMAFRFRIKNAAMRAGFQSTTAGGLSAAYWEMAENATLHSGAPRSALAGYFWSERRFEFVVADAGQGVMSSLKPSYPSLKDHGAALRLALEDGVSRFGPAANRGNGFGTLFRKLVGLNGSVRLRSGDHALLIAGQSPSRGNANTAQRAAYNGFFICLTCTT